MENNLIEEKDLDELLNTAFLEENSNAADILSARFILEQKYDAAIDPKKEHELLTKLKGNTNGGREWRYFFLLIGTSVIITSILLLFSKSISTDQVSIRENLNKVKKCLSGP